MKNIQFLVVACFCIISIFIRCTSDGNNSDEYTINRYKTAQLNNIYNNEILPLHQGFSVETLTLSNEMLNFNTEISLENLNILKQQWKLIADLWKKCELYDIGIVKNSFIHYTINSWPANTSFIENSINTTSTINENYISSIGFSSKGIAAIEYLLFNNDDLTTINLFLNSPARLAYLKSCILDLHANSNTILSLWELYKNEFVTNIQSGISGSQNEVINNMVTLLEEIIISKLNNAINQNTIYKFEAFRSDYSLSLIKNNIISIHRCYTGDFKLTPFRVGFKTYLNQLGYEELSIEIDQKFNAINSTIESMDTSLNSSLNSNPDSISDLRDKIEELLFLIKIDMSNAIGSTITFNANDGD